MKKKTTADRKYWLFKSEPDCFSMDHLAACPKKTDSWDGVRNYQARNFMRDDIKKGDGVLFYYSSTSPVGVAGICEVVRSGYPDHTARDPKEMHYDPKATENNPIWFMVDVKFVRKFPHFVTLTELKQTPGLESMMVTQRGSRLSIQPVTTKEWDIVLKLAEKLEK